MQKSNDRENAALNKPKLSPEQLPTYYKGKEKKKWFKYTRLLEWQLRTAG